MEIKAKTHSYATSVHWAGEKKGVIRSAGKPDVPVATPPEFHGHAGMWSPEDLLVAAVNTCLMATYLALAERAGITLASYNSEAEGKLEWTQGTFQVTQITVRPAVTVTDAAQLEAAGALFAKAERGCFISQSVKASVTLVPTLSAPPA